MAQGSDLDLLAASCRLSPDTFFRKAQEALPLSQLAPDAAVPLLRVDRVEVQFAPLRSDQLALLQAGAFEALEAQLQDATGLAALLDVAALLSTKHFEAYRHHVVQVKSWARRNQLLGTPFGFPGGFAWALLVKEAGHKAENGSKRA